VKIYFTDSRPVVRHVIKDSANYLLRNADVTFDVGANRVEVHTGI